MAKEKQLACGAVCLRTNEETRSVETELIDLRTLPMKLDGAGQQMKEYIHKTVGICGVSSGTVWWRSGDSIAWGEGHLFILERRAHVSRIAKLGESPKCGWNLQLQKQETWRSNPMSTLLAMRNRIAARPAPA